MFLSINKTLPTSSVVHSTSESWHPVDIRKPQKPWAREPCWLLTVCMCRFLPCHTNGFYQAKKIVLWFGNKILAVSISVTACLCTVHFWPCTFEGRGSILTPEMAWRAFHFRTVGNFLLNWGRNCNIWLVKLKLITATRISLFMQCFESTVSYKSKLRRLMELESARIVGDRRYMSPGHAYICTYIQAHIIECFIAPESSPTKYIWFVRKKIDAVAMGQIPYIWRWEMKFWESKARENTCSIYAWCAWSRKNCARANSCNLQSIFSPRHACMHKLLPIMRHPAHLHTCMRRVVTLSGSRTCIKKTS